MSTTAAEAPLQHESAVVAFHIIGDAFVDLFSFLDGDWPEKGGDATLNQPIQTYAGGSSTNTATHLNALLNYFQRPQQQDAMELTLHTILNSNDQFGKVLLNHAEKHKFELVNCKQDDDNAATGHCVAIVAGQERSFMTYRGCVDNFDAHNLDTQRIINGNNNIHHVHLHIAGFFNLSNFQHGKITQQIQLIKKQRQELYPSSRTIVSMVPQHDATKLWDGGIDELIPCLDFLIMNDLEALHIMQQGKKRRQQKQTTNGATTTNSNNSPADAIETLVEDCAAYFGEISPQTCVILTKGPLGAVALQHGTMIATQSTVSVKPIDPTGAGDSFSAGFLYGLWAWRQQQQQSVSSSPVESSHLPQFAWPAEALEQALLWGCSMGTSSVLVRGASIPSSKEDIEQFYAKINETNGHQRTTA